MFPKFWPLSVRRHPPLEIEDEVLPLAESLLFACFLEMKEQRGELNGDASATALSNFISPAKKKHDASLVNYPRTS